MFSYDIIAIRIIDVTRCDRNEGEAKCMQSSTGQMVRQMVAAYARVSTEHEEQQSSYEAQVDYYTRKITGRSDWGIVEVYTDKGISGTNTKNVKASTV